MSNSEKQWTIDFEYIYLHHSLLPTFRRFMPLWARNINYPHLCKKVSCIFLEIIVHFREKYRIFPWYDIICAVIWRYFTSNATRFSTDHDIISNAISRFLHGDMTLFQRRHNDVSETAWRCFRDGMTMFLLWYNDSRDVLWCLFRHGETSFSAEYVDIFR